MRQYLFPVVQEGVRQETGRGAAARGVRGLGSEGQAASNEFTERASTKWAPLIQNGEECGRMDQPRELRVIVSVHTTAEGCGSLPSSNAALHKFGICSQQAHAAQTSADEPTTEAPSPIAASTLQRRGRWSSRPGSAAHVHPQQTHAHGPRGGANHVCAGTRVNLGCRGHTPLGTSPPTSQRTNSLSSQSLST